MRLSKPKITRTEVHDSVDSFVESVVKHVSEFERGRRAAEADIAAWLKSVCEHTQPCYLPKCLDRTYHANRIARSRYPRLSDKPKE